MSDHIHKQPCPMCGSGNIAPPRIHDGFAWVECLKCGTRGPSRKGREESAMAWNTRVDVGQFSDIVTAVQARDFEIDKLKDRLTESNAYARRLSIKVTDQGNEIVRLKNMLEVESRRAKDFEEALDEIGKSVPCSQGGGGWFWPYCDGDGNEVGAIPVDPAQVFQEMAGIAQNALNMKPNA